MNFSHESLLKATETKVVFAKFISCVLNMTLAYKLSSLKCHARQTASSWIIRWTIWADLKRCIHQSSTTAPDKQNFIVRRIFQATHKRFMREGMIYSWPRIHLLLSGIDLLISTRWEWCRQSVSALNQIAEVKHPLQTFHDITRWAKAHEA